MLQYNRLIFAGDVMLSRDVRRQILESKDYALPFRKIAPLMSSADIAFINLESPFSAAGPYYAGGLIFHAAPQMIAGLELANIAVASTANNHARDCGPEGVAFTVEWLRQHGIAPVGSGLNANEAHAGVVLTRHGVRFGFLGYTYDQSNGNWKDVDTRVALADPAVMRADVKRLKARSDVVIVSMHHGIEYQKLPSSAQVEFAHAAVDAGATLVIGHHPHVIEPDEHYHGGQIFYSLGNFVFDQYQREATQHGELLQISLVGYRILAAHRMHVLITKTGPELDTSINAGNARRGGSAIRDIYAPSTAWLPHSSVAGGPLHVPSELESHSRQHLLSEGLLAPRSEAGK